MEQTKNKSNVDFWQTKTIVTYFLSVLVFFIHISTFSNYSNEGLIGKLNGLFSIALTDVLTPIAVPLFFILSGATMFRNFTKENYVRKLKSRIQTLVIPYLLWNIVGLIFSLITSYTFISSYFIGRARFEVNLENVLLAIFHHGCNGPFWFIFNLIIFSVCAPLISFLINRRWSGLLFIFILMVANEYGLGLPETVFYSRLSLIFYVIGCVIGKHFFNEFSKGDKKHVFTWATVFLLLVFFYIIRGIAGFAIPSYVIVVLLTLYAIAFWNIMVELCANRIIRYRSFMENSFAVYALHVNVSAIITKVIYLILPKNNLFAIFNFVVTVILTLVVIQIICQMLKRYAPVIYCTLMGKSDR